MHDREERNGLGDGARRENERQLSKTEDEQAKATCSGTEVQTKEKKGGGRHGKGISREAHS